MRYLLLSLLVSIAAAGTLSAQQYRQLTDVPTIYIETEGGKNIVSKEDYINCTLIYVDEEQTTRYENGEYRGTFQISDQVQVHKKRVDISEEDGMWYDINGQGTNKPTKKGIYIYNQQKIIAK